MAMLMDLPDELILQILSFVDKFPFEPRKPYPERQSRLNSLSSRLLNTAAITATICLVWAFQVKTLQKIGLPVAPLYRQGWDDPLCVSCLFLLIHCSDTLHEVWETLLKGHKLSRPLNIPHLSRNLRKAPSQIISVSSVNHRLHRLCIDFRAHSDILNRNRRGTSSETSTDPSDLGEKVDPTSFN